MNETIENETCIFCGRDLATFPNMKFIQSGMQNLGICFNCNEKIHDIVKTKFAKDTKKDAKDFVNSIKIYKPKEIKAKLDEYVIGQEKAKIALSVAIYNHYKKIINNVNNEKEFLEKSNILMIGPSASGKTLLAKNTAKILGVPFCICDATSLTEAGYVGDDVESCITKLLQAADYSVEKAQLGIVFIDEIDKIAKKNCGASRQRDISGEGVQQALLKIIEGSVVDIPSKEGKKDPNAETIKVDTKNILFILGGAFVGLKEEKEKKLNNVGHLGFVKFDDKTENAKSADVVFEPEDIIEYGFIPEFIGRVPIIVTLDKLTEKQFSQILLEPKDSIINQYTKLMKMDDIELTFDKEAIKEIAKRAYAKDTGARGLRSILEKIMNNFMYELPSSNKKNLKITKKTVESSFK